MLFCLQALRIAVNDELQRLEKVSHMQSLSHASLLPHSIVGGLICTERVSMIVLVFDNLVQMLCLVCTRIRACISNDQTLASERLF